MSLLLHTRPEREAVCAQLLDVVSRLCAHGVDHNTMHEVTKLFADHALHNIDVMCQVSANPNSKAMVIRIEIKRTPNEPR